MLPLGLTVMQKLILQVLFAPMVGHACLLLNIERIVKYVVFCARGVWGALFHHRQNKQFSSVYLHQNERFFMRT